MNIVEYNNMTEEEKRKYWEENHKFLTEQDEMPADKALYELFGPNGTYKLKERGEYSELDVQASAPEMQLFSINDAYFDNKEEMEEYAQMEGLDVSRAYIIEYIRAYAGRSDVIREIDSKGNSLYFKACDEDGYGIYNSERSNREGRFIWEFSEGSIEDMYEPFRKRGIVFDQDVYGEIREDEEKFLQMCREHNFFNSQKNNE